MRCGVCVQCNPAENSNPERTIIELNPNQGQLEVLFLKYIPWAMSTRVVEKIIFFLFRVSFHFVLFLDEKNPPRGVRFFSLNFVLFVPFSHFLLWAGSIVQSDC